MLRSRIVAMAAYSMLEIGLCLMAGYALESAGFPRYITSSALDSASGTEDGSWRRGTPGDNASYQYHHRSATGDHSY